MGKPGSGRQGKGFSLVNPNIGDAMNDRAANRTPMLSHAPITLLE